MVLQNRACRQDMQSILIEYIAANDVPGFQFHHVNAHQASPWKVFSYCHVINKRRTWQ